MDPKSHMKDLQLKYKTCSHLKSILFSKKGDVIGRSVGILVSVGHRAHVV